MSWLADLPVFLTLHPSLAPITPNAARTCSEANNRHSLPSFHSVREHYM